MFVADNAPRGAKITKIFNTEKTEQTESKKLKRIFQSLPSPFALFSPVNLFGLRLVRVVSFCQQIFLLDIMGFK